MVTAVTETSRRGVGEAGRVAYNPALDGLRALAVLAVLGFHMRALRGGYLGVDVFFVLSGFLITRLLLAELDQSGTVSLRRFYGGRATRLLPAFWLLTVVAIFSVAVLRLDPIVSEGDFFESCAAATFYFNDYVQALRPGSGGGWFGHSWSLSVEEQFYLLWPLGLAVWCRRRVGIRRLRAALLGGIVGVAGWRLALAAMGASWHRIYFAFDTRADALLAGCLLAAWLRGDAPIPAGAIPAGAAARVRRIPRSAGPVALAVLATLVCVLPDVETTGARVLFEGGYTGVAAVSGVLILALELRRPVWLFRLLAARPLAWLGRVSYGVYLWHYPVVIYWGRGLAHRVGRWPAVLAACVISIGLAAASYYLVEQPIRRRRRSGTAAPAAVRAGLGRQERRIRAGFSSSRAKQPTTCRQPSAARQRKYSDIELSGADADTEPRHE
jgi:peptidoglycan/LPS O-acetylase OafA/YrhL